jgi:DNA primase
VSAVDHGFQTVSPGTTNFRRADFEKLAHLTQATDSIYVINDNEEDQAGENGARNTGSYLASHGKNVFIVQLPRPEGIDKIDLNEYLRDHTATDLRQLMEEAKGFLDMLIYELPQDFIKALPKVKTDIVPILAQLEGGVLEHYTEALTTRLKTTKKARGLGLVA